MSKLANNETSGDFTHVVKLTYQDLQAIGTGGTVEIATLPAKAMVELVMVDESVPFVGSSTVDITIGTYDTADAVVDVDSYITALAVDAMSNPVFNTGPAFTTAEGVANKLMLSGGGSAGAQVTVASKIVLTYTDAAAASLTAGEMLIGGRVLDLQRFS